MSTRLIGLIAALAMMAPAGAMAMPAAGLAPVAAPQVTADGAKLDRAAVVVRTGRPFVRRPFVRRVGPRPFVRRGFARPGIGVGIGPRGGVGVRIR